MPNHRPTPYRLTETAQLHSLVEHRSTFTLLDCELNIFETRQHATDFRLGFHGFGITSMLRGKKLMHLKGYEDFEYIPGETVLAPQGSEMVIDFPDAEWTRPTQCTSLVIEPGYLGRKLNEINSRKNSTASEKEWKIDIQEIFLRNDFELAQVSSRLIKVFSSNDPFKDTHADLILQELVLCILRLQHRNELSGEAIKNPNGAPFSAILYFIRQNLTSNIRVEDLCRLAGMSQSHFYRQFLEYTGMTPIQLILEERLRYAKELLNKEEVSVKEVAYASGFNDPNYFSRIFKKQEGITPGKFRRAGTSNNKPKGCRKKV